VNARIRLLLAGVLFSLGGALIKACTFPSLQRAGLRSLIAAITLFLLLPEARRLPDRRIALLLLPYFGATCLFVVANAMTTAANAIFLQSTAPFWVVLLAPMLLGERIGKRDLAMLACIGFGIAMFFLTDTDASATATDPRLGNLLALVSGLAYGTLLVGLRWLSQRDANASCAVVAWGNVANVPLAWVAGAAMGQGWTSGDASSWVSIAVLGTLQVGLAYALLVRAMPHVPAVSASLLLMIEPALNPLLAYLAHGEVPHAAAVVGGLVILGAVLAGSWRKK
jgi:drug/metabolite transporter (DMT)-like permease